MMSLAILLLATMAEQGRIRWDDPDSCPIARTYEHAIVASGVDPEGKVGAMILHEWEKSPRGTRMRSTMRFLGPVPPGLPEIWKTHDRAEVSTFPRFLPELYRLWQAVKDPAINRQCSPRRSSPEITKYPIPKPETRVSIFGSNSHGCIKGTGCSIPHRI